MNYSQALAWLYSTQQHGIKLGLENIRALLSRLPACKSKIIHVAGTNGKGSVCAMIDSLARAQGLRCGLYTSPHLVSFRERIKVQGRMIDEESVAKGLSHIRELIASLEIQPTFFEITTALAIKYFAESELDLVVLETGMGGRLDATNALNATVSVITPISMDHQQWLGSSLPAIAGEKAGITKPGIPVISSKQEPAAEAVLREAALAAKTTIEFVTQGLEGFEIGLQGSHQRFNAALSIQALHQAALPPSKEAVAKGLGSLSWPGRFQLVDKRFVLDGAHNKAAAERLAVTWREIYGEKKTSVILGILGDKEIDAICAALLPIADVFVIVPVASPRSADPVLIRQVLERMNANVEVAPGLKAALDHAKAFPALVTGSLFLVGEALSILQPEQGAAEISSQ